VILPCGTATSQTLPSTIDNDQLQSGEVFADQPLDVVEVTDGVNATTTATGNSADFTVDTGDMDVRSNQTLQGNVRASTTVNVTGGSGASSTLSTAATGNTGDAGIVSGTHTGIYNQNTEAVTISANGHVEAPDAQAGDVTQSVQAVGNSQGISASYGATGARVNQVNDAEVTSDGGGLYGYVSGQATFTATTAANNATVAGAGSGQRVEVNQQNNADVTQAAQFTNYGNAYLADTQATATGNNVSASEQGPILDVTTNQTNLAYTRAEAVNSGYEFGAGTAVAYGVGNSMVAGNVGPETVIDNNQVNDGGGVDAAASYTGYQGYDATASATAIGNAAAGYACSDCQGRVTATNRQANNADIGATSQVSVTSGRSVYGVANAVGNTASYYVSRPSY
jgi:hypothetical protein